MILNIDTLELAPNTDTNVEYGLTKTFSDTEDVKKGQDKLDTLAVLLNNRLKLTIEELITTKKVSTEIKKFIFILHTSYELDTEPNYNVTSLWYSNSLTKLSKITFIFPHLNVSLSFDTKKCLINIKQIAIYTAYLNLFELEEKANSYISMVNLLKIKLPVVQEKLFKLFTNEK